jgi:hypothetical protein
LALRPTAQTFAPNHHDWRTIADFSHEFNLEADNWRKSESGKRWFGQYRGITPWMVSKCPKKANGEYILHRVVTEKQLQFIKKHRGLFPHKQVTSLYDRNVVPTSGSEQYLASLIASSYYRKKPLKMLTIRVPADTKIFAWEGGLNIALPYFVPLSRIKVSKVKKTSLRGQVVGY